MKKKYGAGAFVAVMFVAALVYVYGGTQVPPGQPPLERLTMQNVVDVKNGFNAAKDDVRVLLLLSPT